MQDSQAFFIIMDILVIKKMGFLRLRNRVNVACSRAQDGLVIVGDVDQKSYHQFSRSERFENAFHKLLILS